MSQKMTTDDIASLAGPAFAAAYDAAIADGFSVLEARGNTLVEVSPDGAERVVKQIDGPTSATVGDRYLIGR